MREDDLSDAFAYALGSLPPESRQAALESFLEACATAMYGKTIPGSGNYQRTTREEAPGAAYSKTWDAREWGPWADKVQTGTGIPNPMRGKTLERFVRTKALALKRMIASTTFEGERINAQAALDRLMEKHNFTERDL